MSVKGVKHLLHLEQNISYNLYKYLAYSMTTECSCFNGGCESCLIPVKSGICIGLINVLAIY